MKTELSLNELEAEKLDIYVGTCHTCDRNDVRVIAIDTRYQHAQTAYCSVCLYLLLRRLDRS